MIFRNREQAALQLLSHLEQYRGTNPLVLAIPRGGVPVAEIIVESLGGELDLMLAGKMTSETNPELALGAITESGFTEYGPVSHQLGFERDELDKMARRTLALLQSKRELFVPLVPPVDPYDRVVILVDDGIATGATMSVAAQAVRAARPERLIVASPVASFHAVERLKQLADDVVVLDTPSPFYSVSQFYDDFSQVSDDDVIHILSESRKMKPMREAVQRGTAPVFPAYEPRGV